MFWKLPQKILTTLKIGVFHYKQNFNEHLPIPAFLSQTIWKKKKITDRQINLANYWNHY